MGSGMRACVWGRMRCPVVLTTCGLGTVTDQGQGQR